MSEAPQPFYETQGGPNENENYLETNKYIIKMNNNSIELLLARTNSDIFIKSYYYEVKFSQSELTLLTKIVYSSIEESYDFIKNILA